MDSLEEELLAVDAIYPGCVSRDAHSPRRLAIRPFFDTEPSAASLTLSMPQDYPDVPPTLLGHNGLSQSHILDVLDTSWTPGEVCLYVLIDNLREHPTGSNTNVTQGSVRNATIQSVSSSSSDDGDDQDYQFAVSDPIVDRKSTFVGRAISVQSKAEAQAALLWLKQHNKKVAKATHNIVALRLIENGVLMQDNDDDGEDAAGGRIAHLLEMTDLKNVMLVVSRWYGGIMLHGDRFKHISNVARDALRVGGFLPEPATPAAKGGAKRHSKKRK